MMLLSTLELVGFRNFKNCKINFAEKTLIIGSNDVGKSNLLHALRLLFDRSISETDIQPTDSDFYAYEDTDEFKITAYFSGITTPEDDCIISHFGGAIQNDSFCLQMHATRDAHGKIDYKILSGKDDVSLKDTDGRRHTKRLNLQYLASYRDLKSYIKKEQRVILDASRQSRTSAEEQEDIDHKTKLEGELNAVTKRVGQFNFIRKATHKFNDELKKLSAENKNRTISFDAGATDSEKFMNNLSLVSHKHGKLLALGGDGRNNQIFLSMWASTKEKSLSEICLYAIEEPEAHLHPHQQRKLSEYLVETGQGQIIITSHSPQIAAEFTPSSIVRLYSDGQETLAANEGCSKKVEDAAIDFAHRMNMLQAEAFFSDAVLLVEGVSEVLFYKALAKSLGKSLDHYNISVISVEGVGFATYARLLDALGIPFCLRTDNDCIKVPRQKPTKPKYRNAGLERVFNMFMKRKSSLTKAERLKFKHEYNAVYFQKKARQSKEAAAFIKANERLFNESGYFLASKDLEADLLRSPIKTTILTYTQCTNAKKALAKMQSSKGTWMFGFIKKHESDLSVLAKSKFVTPIEYLIKVTGK